MSSVTMYTWARFVVAQHDHVLYRHHVWVATQVPQEAKLAQQPLRRGLVAACVRHLLDRYLVAVAPVRCHHAPERSLPDELADRVAVADVKDRASKRRSRLTRWRRRRVSRRVGLRLLAFARWKVRLRRAAVGVRGSRGDSLVAHRRIRAPIRHGSVRRVRAPIHHGGVQWTARARSSAK